MKSTPTNKHPYRLRGVRFVIEAKGFRSDHTEAEAVRIFKRRLSREITTTAAAKTVAQGFLNNTTAAAAYDSTLKAIEQAREHCPRFPVLRLTYAGEDS